MQSETIEKIKNNYKRIERSVVEQLFLEFTNHNPTTGSYREDVWQSLFRQVVPYKFSIAKSVFIIDSNGEISKEVDLAIFDEQYTPYIFNYGNVRFVPIEAVAVVVQCKSNYIDNTNLHGWKDSIKKLKTDTRSITRMYPDVVNGSLVKIHNGENKTFTQTSTRPIQILCHLENDKDNTKPKADLFDIVICANYEKEDDPKLIIDYPNNLNIGQWYESLNHCEEGLKQYTKKYSNLDTMENKYKVGDNSILSLIFQLNQLLMLINNPMLFPHQAYVDMFNKSDAS